MSFIPNLVCLHRGKVRDTYALPAHPELRLVVASDRISIFDFVLNAKVEEKGAVLTAMNLFWRKFIGNTVAGDVVASGTKIDEYFPIDLRNNPALQQRALVVRTLDMLSCEAIVRGYLTGSGLKAYQKDGIVCGHRLPTGLQDGDALPCAIFTPSTKAEIGHDEHVTADSIGEKYGVGVERLTLTVFAIARAYAETRGIILADTKFEWGLHLENKGTVLGDEVLTPDSSRFWDAKEWRQMQKQEKRQSPTSFDKQYVREWGKTVGIDKRDPALSDDVTWVRSQLVPTDILRHTTQIYRYIFWRLTRMKLEAFQQFHMGLSVTPKPVKIEIVTGSQSDLEQAQAGLNYLNLRSKYDGVLAQRHVISCHRNPSELAQFAKELPSDCIVIAGAGLAAALPGVLKALLTQEGKGDIPVIGVGFRGKTEEANEAARLSITQLPGKPVILDADGKAYFGPDGFREACVAAVEHEFLTPTSPAPVPAQRNIPIS